MEFTCRTKYDLNTLTAMARAVRKTVRSERSVTSRHRGWFIAGLFALSMWMSWGTAWQIALTCAVAAVLALVSWKEDAINARLAMRAALPGTEVADALFRADCFLIKTAAAETSWQYDGILAAAETGGYIVFVMGRDHALAFDKAALSGGSLTEFRAFIEEKSGLKLRSIGG